MTPEISVAIPAHNPLADFLPRVLRALEAQSLPRTEWELIVVDNGSSPPLAPSLGWHPRARLVGEPRLGLTHARLRAFAEAKGALVVLVDDDNVLDPNYLSTAAEIARLNPQLGTWSGRITLEFQDAAAAPAPIYHQFLTTREIRQAVWSNDPNHHTSTPWGAGLCVRSAVARAYGRLVAEDPRRAQLDLQGRNLVYGGDTDIAYCGCRMGLGKGVFPQLHLTHLIPRGRCELPYLLRSAEGQGYSEILHGYLLSGVVPETRKDLLGRMGATIRALSAGKDARAIDAARRRGRSRAVQELRQSARGA